MCVFLLRHMKTKNFNVVLSLCQRCHLTRLKVFQAGCFNLEQMKAFVKLCMNKLYNTAAKFELKPNC